MKIVCGGYHTICLSSEDEIFAFGAGSYGECGYGEAKDTLVPKVIRLPENSYQTKNLSDDGDSYKLTPSKPSVKAIACGGRHNLILTKDGALFSFGFG